MSLSLLTNQHPQVDPEHQNTGVATALVVAAERRLATVCAGIQIEYQYTEGDDFSRRLEQLMPDTTYGWM